MVVCESLISILFCSMSDHAMSSFSNSLQINLSEELKECTLTDIKSSPGSLAKIYSKLPTLNKSLTGNIAA